MKRNQYSIGNMEYDKRIQKKIFIFNGFKDLKEKS